jgi:phage terminase small subunit
MPALDNPRHERFAQELAKGKSADEAYQLAGYSENRGNATRMKANESVHARVQELTERAAEKAVLTKSWVIERLMTNAERALQEVAVRDSEGNQTGEFEYEGAVANRALELLGKELGMFVDRSENVNRNHVVSGELPTDAEWEARHVTPN